MNVSVLKLEYCVLKPFYNITILYKSKKKLNYIQLYVVLKSDLGLHCLPSLVFT